MKRFTEICIFLLPLWILAMILGLVAPDFCHAGLKWRSIGPEGGSVGSVVIDPINSSIVYAGSDGGGVFKSTNRGAPGAPSIPD
jgi:hypothetical protein